MRFGSCEETEGIRLVLIQEQESVSRNRFNKIRCNEFR